MLHLLAVLSVFSTLNLQLFVKKKKKKTKPKEPRAV